MFFVTLSSPGVSAVETHFITQTDKSSQAFSLEVGGCYIQDRFGRVEAKNIPQAIAIANPAPVSQPGL